MENIKSIQFDLIFFLVRVKIKIINGKIRKVN